jgi:hypothetical protein
MPRKTSTQLNREITEILAKPKRGGPPRPAGDPHQLARDAANEAFRTDTPEAHRRAAKAFRVSAQTHRKTQNRELSDYQEKNAEMHERAAQEAQFDWTSVANTVQTAAERTHRRLGSDITGYKVFVADAYRSLTPRERAAIGAPTLPQFKQLLSSLNRRQLISLTRNDIPEMWVNEGRSAKAREVSRKLDQESAIDSQGSTLHFIRVDGAQ